MKVEKLAAIGEIVSSIAIVITLAYLAIQTQQNTAAIASASRQQLAEIELDAYYELAEHTDAIVQFRTTCDGELFTSDGIGLLITLEAWFVAKNHAWREYENGILDEETWNASMAGLRNVFGFAATPQIWRLAKDALSPGFVEYVEQEIEAATVPQRCN
jgi:hypothetical protein